MSHLGEYKEIKKEEPERGGNLGRGGVTKPKGRILWRKRINTG